MYDSGSRWRWYGSSFPPDAVAVVQQLPKESEDEFYTVTYEGNDVSFGETSDAGVRLTELCYMDEAGESCFYGSDLLSAEEWDWVERYAEYTSYSEAELLIQVGYIYNAGTKTG